MKLEQEILDLIDKDLPNQVGKILKERLEQAEKDCEEVFQLKGKLLETTDLLKKNTLELSSINSELTKKSKIWGDLETKRIELENRERNFKLEITELRGLMWNYLAPENF